MATKKISELDAATTPLAGTEQVPIVQGGATKKATAADLRAGPAGGVLSGTYPNPGFAVDMATQTELDDHINDTAGAHAATAISNTPAGSIAATTVQAAIDELNSEKEPSITAGTASQYWRGNKTWADFFTDVRASTLTGLSTATNAVITAADTVLTALGKLQKQVSDNLTTLTSHTGNVSNPHSTTKTQVGLGNVDNTSDATKDAATATLTNKTLTTPVLSNPSFSGTTANMGTVTTIDINGGTADGMTMGASAALARVNTDRLETTRTAVTAPASTDGNIFSGTYTPSLTPVTNIGASAAVACQYMRVGNVVSVSGHVYLGPAATGPTLIGVTLPIPSNFTIPSQLGGTFAASGVDENPGSIYADTANDLAVFDIQAKQTAVAAYTFHFTYVVL